MIPTLQFRISNLPVSYLKHVKIKIYRTVILLFSYGWTMRWPWHVAHKGDTRNAYKNLVGKP